MSKINLLILLLASVIFSATTKAQDIDYLALSSMLIKGQNFSRARTALANAKKEWDDIEHEHYYLLNGLYLLRTGNAEKAIKEFQLVKDEEYLLKRNTYEAEAYLSLNKPQEALVSINRIKINEETPSSVKQLKAKILFENKNISQGFAILNSLKGSDKLLIHYLTEYELFEEAFELINNYLKDKGAKQYLQMAAFLQQKKQFEKSILLLEQALLKFPKESEVLNQLALSYENQRKSFVASDLFTRLAYQDASYAHDVADFLISKNRHSQAQVINMMVSENKKQVLQKLSFYLGEENYDLARSLETPLKQVNAFKDDEIKYAMAYTYLMQGEYDFSMRLLKNIKKAKLLDKSLRLIKLVGECQNSKWECYGTL